MSSSPMKATGGFASLTSGLLARKGGAKPAMRPSISTSLDDLGWNDMGHEPVQMPAYPEPLKYQDAIAEEFKAPVEMLAPVEASVSVEVPAAVVKALPPAKKSVRRVARKPELAFGKVAFTLRLDGDRHLRLRLATAVTNRSAQKIVTDALDAYLAAHPELDQLAGQVPPATSDGLN